MKTYKQPLSDRLWRKAVFGILFLFSCLSLSAQEEPKLSLNGYVKYLQNTTIYGFTGQAPTTNNLFHNRLNFNWYPGGGWTVSAGMRNRLFFGEEVKMVPDYGNLIDQYEGLLDLSILWVNDEAVVLHTVFDRAYIDWTKDKWSLRIGRQRINWGVNLVWNPNDLFNAFNYLDFDYEERPGSDAVRIQYFPTAMSKLEVAFSPARNIEQSVGAVMYRFNYRTYDIQLLAGYYRGDLAIGTGWAGNLGQAGFKGEATWFQPMAPSPDSISAFSASITIDYQIGRVYTSGAILYNSNGNRSDLIQGGSVLIGAPPSPKNLFPSDWTVFTQAMWQATPLFTVSGGVIYGLNLNQTIFIPTLTYSIKENWDLDAIGQVYLLQPKDQAYQHFGSGIFMRMKWSF